MWLTYGRMCPSDEQAESVKRIVQQDMLRSVMPAEQIVLDQAQHKAHETF